MGARTVADRVRPSDALILPALFVRFVPIVANARIPGRAIVVVYLVVAMLAAMGWIAWYRAAGRDADMAWGLVLMVIIECHACPAAALPAGHALEYAALQSRHRPERFANSRSDSAMASAKPGRSDFSDPVASDDPRAADRGRVRRPPSARDRGDLREHAGLHSLLRLSSGRAASDQDLTLLAVKRPRRSYQPGLHSSCWIRGELPPICAVRAVENRVAADRGRGRSSLLQVQ